MKINVKVLVLAAWLLVANNVVGSDKIYNFFKFKTSKHKESASSLRIRAVNMNNASQKFYRVPSGKEEQIRGDIVIMDLSNQINNIIRIEVYDKNVKPLKVCFSGMITENQYNELKTKLIAKS